MVNVVIAAPVSRFEMESDQAGVSLRVNFRELITDVKRRPIWHGPHQPCNLIGLYGGVWMSPVFLVVLKVALEYHQAIIKTIRVSLLIDFCCNSGKRLKIENHKLSFLKT